jgi:hypothetical protein
MTVAGLIGQHIGRPGVGQRMLCSFRSVMTAMLARRMPRADVRSAASFA